MKFLFLLDDQQYLDIAPEALQLRQTAPGVTGLGFEVTANVIKEDGTPELNEDGSQKTQQTFRSFINYPVNLVIPEPEAEATAPELADGATN